MPQASSSSLWSRNSWYSARALWLAAFGESAELRALQIKYADEPVLQQQGDHHFRSNVITMGKFDVSSIYADIFDADRKAVSRSVPRDSFEKGDRELYGYFLFVVLCKSTF